MEIKKSIINLESLLDLSAKLHFSNDINYILHTTLLSLMGKLLITKGNVYLKKNDNFDLIIQKENYNITELIDNIPSDFVELTKTKKYKSLEKQQIQYIIPIKIDDEIESLIVLGRSIRIHSLTNEEITYIKLISNICGNSLKNAFNYLDLKNSRDRAEKQSQLLKTLFEVSRDIASLIKKEQIIKTIGLVLMGQLTVTKFAIFIKDKNKTIELVNRFDTKISHKELKEFFKINKTQLIQNQKSQIKIISPMYNKGEKKGILLISNKLSQSEYTHYDIQFTEAIGNTAIIAIENERLIQEEIIKNQLENELKIAYDIQKRLLPHKIPQLRNFEIYGQTLPSRYVGGDYFDYIKISKNKYLLVIADVSGKGVPASLLMANLQASLRILALREKSLLKIIEQTNKQIYRSTEADKFITGFFCIIDDNDGTMEYLNAGHNPPYLIENKKYKKLTDGGLILGFIEPPPQYKTNKIKLDKETVIISFTDGILDARNLSDEEYGEERFLQLIINSSSKSPQNIYENIIKNLDNFVNGNIQYDDITFLIIKRK